MNPVAIIGGGITGLSAAYYLHRSQVPFVLLEATGRFGGALHTHRHGGFIIEAGADSWITQKPWAAQLARDLGIAGRLIGSNDTHRTTYILRGNRLLPMPRGMKFFVPADLDAAYESPLFSPAMKRAFASELQFQPREMSGDESVAAFSERHFGPEFVHVVVDPLLAGVYGGDSRNLSARAVLPAFVEAERKHGSLIRAFEQSDATEESVFTSFHGGMQELVDALLEHLPAHALRLNTAVKRILRDQSGWVVDGQRYSSLILAAPPRALGPILPAGCTDLAAELASIPFADAITVSLAFEGEGMERLPPGFGFLVPKREQRALLACTFVHQKWPMRVPGRAALLRLFLTETSARSDEHLIAIARSEAQSLLGIAAAPIYSRVDRWPQAMPHYSVGHLERIQRIERLSASAHLRLAGNAYRGIGVSDCVREGREAAEAVLNELPPAPSG